jgi:hypothetical protein
MDVWRSYWIFCQSFQINQGLIDEENYYGRLLIKMNEQCYERYYVVYKNECKRLEQPYRITLCILKKSGAPYWNVYRYYNQRKSNGEKFWSNANHSTEFEFLKRSLMTMNFLIKITALTYPEVGEFLKTYVAGTTLFPYDFTFKSWGNRNNN